MLKCPDGRRPNAPAGSGRQPALSQEEDDAVGRKAREEVSSLPVIVGGLLGLMLADYVFRNRRFIH